jgi:phosphatidate cytidylyltransferase
MEKDKKMLNIAKLIITTTKMILKFVIKYIKSNNSGGNLRKRIISSLILIPLAIYAIFFSINLFIAIAIAITILMTMEWQEIIKPAEEYKKWQIIGVFYILIPVYSVIKIRLLNGEQNGAQILLWMFAIIWSTDIMAFFIGKSFGGPKIAPHISPNKTWSGAIGGLITSAIIGVISASVLFKGSIAFFIAISIILSIIEQVSDLIESKIKRTFGVKDSGNIIPGHGGVLDRLDGMILVAPAVLFLLIFFENNF